jgi:hypothetical protein
LTTLSFDQPDVKSTQYFVFDNTPACSSWTDASTSINRVKKGALVRAETPNFKAALARGELLPLNAYRKWDYLAERGQGFVSRTRDQSGKLCTSHISQYHYPYFYLYDGERVLAEKIPDPWAEVNAEALKVQAIANCAADLDTLTTLAESHKTLAMVRDVREDAKRLILKALRGGRHTAQAAANAWLWWKYGWQQLGYDMQNIADFVNNPIKSHIVEGRAGVSPLLKLVIPPEEVVMQSGTWTTTRTCTIDGSCRAHAVVRYYTRGLNQVASIPTTMWELVPYSFVVDWFINVGDVLRAWDVLLLAKDVRVSLGDKMSMKVNTTATYGPPGSNPQWVAASGSGLLDELYERKTRIPSNVPSLVPSLQVRLTGSRIIDAASLCTKPIINSSFRR